MEGQALEVPVWILVSITTMLEPWYLPKCARCQCWPWLDARAWRECFLKNYRDALSWRFFVNPGASYCSLTVYMPVHHCVQRRLCCLSKHRDTSLGWNLVSISGVPDKEKQQEVAHFQVPHWIFNPDVFLVFSGHLKSSRVVLHFLGLLLELTLLLFKIRETLEAI